MLASRFAALAALSLISIASAAAQPAGGAVPAARTIQVWSYGFGPQPIQLAAGQPVTLAFVNQAGVGHDFTAKDFFANSAITAGAAPGGKIELAPHATVAITLTPRAGTYMAHCSHFLHESLGMHDQIVVS